MPLPTWILTHPKCPVDLFTVYDDDYERDLSDPMTLKDAMQWCEDNMCSLERISLRPYHVAS